jgi:hypothetical protein
MHRWLLVVMVLLLPLRGWVGEAMAGQMLQQHAAIVSAVAGEAARPGHVHADAPAHAHGDGHAQAHDCDHSQGQAPSASEGGQHANGHADCPTCASCQVCSSVALSSVAWLPAPVAYSHPQPQAAQPSFASAEPALAYKPPRS